MSVTEPRGAPSRSARLGSGHRNPLATHSACKTLLDTKRMTEVFVPVRIEVMSLGEAWIAIAAAILTGGVVGSWDGLPIVEVFRATLDVHSPRVDDPIIAQHGDPQRLAWMHANFTDHSRVAELDEAASQAARVYAYARGGRAQIRWVIDRLAANPWTRDATITTFEPLTDASYIPCVSLLDFWLVKDELQLAVYAHAIDFGTKGYANLVELAALQP